MKVLLDECAPKALKRFRSAHGYESRTVQDAGWSGKTNGELLQLAENDFDVLITVDANLRYQQNVAGRKIAILVLLVRSNRLSDLSPHFPEIVTALQTVKPGELVFVGIAR